MFDDEAIACQIASNMNKTKRDELRPGYRRSSLKRGVRGKYLKAYRSAKRNLGEELLQSVREVKAGRRARTLGKKQ